METEPISAEALPVTTPVPDDTAALTVSDKAKVTPDGPDVEGSMAVGTEADVSACPEIEADTDWAVGVEEATDPDEASVVVSPPTVDC